MIVSGQAISVQNGAVYYLDNPSRFGFREAIPLLKNLKQHNLQKE